MEESTSPVFNFFRFKKNNNGSFLLTNDTGAYHLLSEKDFSCLQKTPGELSAPILEQLRDKGFLAGREPDNRYIRQLNSHYGFTQRGPGLHIVVVSLRCDHKCVYCQASRQDQQAAGYDMDIATAEKTCDFILQSPAPRICVEFQGGEPLINFPVIRHIIRYMQEHKKSKKIIFSLVTNLNLMDDGKLNFLMDNRVSICTSLDGPAPVHNRYRILPGGDSFRTTVHWIKRIIAENRKKEAGNEKFNRINALLTASGESQLHYREIIDLYCALGLDAIHLRPVNPFGYGKKLGDAKLFSAEEFIAFYSNSLDYILELNRQGSAFYEKTAQLILEKIILLRDPGFLDMRSPCGAGIGQLAYNYDGRIFTCDEGRMVSATGDDLFQLGNVNDDTYDTVIRSGLVRNMCLASCLEGLPGCHDCVYHPYCGVCPVYNYIEQGSLFGHMPTNERCKMLTGIFDYLFSRLPDHYETFRKWTQNVHDPFLWEDEAVCPGLK